MRGALLLFLALLAIVPAEARREIFIQPAGEVSISRAMKREQLCLVESRARTTHEATAHALRCSLRYR